jgi:hypothetical protein
MSHATLPVSVQGLYSHPNPKSPRPQAMMSAPACCCTSALHMGQHRWPPAHSACLWRPTKHASHSTTCRHGNSATLLGASRHTTQSDTHGSTCRCCCLRICVAGAAAADACTSCCSPLPAAVLGSWHVPCVVNDMNSCAGDTTLCLPRHTMCLQQEGRQLQRPT